MYRFVVYSEAQEQIAELPPKALLGYAEAAAAIELAPWNGRPHHEANPDAEVRRWHFGPDDAGQVPSRHVSAQWTVMCLACSATNPSRLLIVHSTGRS